MSGDTADALVEASSVTVKTMADGTLRLSVDIEPRYARVAFGLFGSPDHDFGGSVEKWAAHAVKAMCEVRRRSEIDGNKDAETRLHTLIRQPYADWLAARGTR